MGLYQKHRPSTLEDMVGNEETIESLRADLTKDDPPCAILLTGATGTGKTTTGRIAGKMLGAEGPDYVEVNFADFRGIDSVRDIRRQAHYSPMGGGRARVWLIDECFAKGTLIESISGPTPIESVRSGAVVWSLAGIDRVRHRFENKVPLDRVCRIRFSNGREVFCSIDHKFFTESGWIKARYLKKGILAFNFDRDVLSSNDIQRTPNGKNDLSRMSRPCTPSQGKKGLKKKGRKGFLFERMWYPIQIQEACKKALLSSVSSMQDSCALLPRSEGALSRGTILQQVLSGKGQDDSTRVSSKVVQRSGRKEEVRVSKTIYDYSRRSCLEEEPFYPSQRAQPNERRSVCGSKDDSNQTDQRDASCVERGTWREWKNFSIGTTSVNCFGLAHVSDSKSRTKTSYYSTSARTQKTGEKPISEVLQDRCRERKVENCDRDRWRESSFETKYTKRCQERSIPNVVGVESVEIYEEGCNDESFVGIIGSEEVNKGYVVFYDLEVENHPSYFANGVAVHNCAKMTGDAQNAFLKLLEDPPSHTHFILATTDPQKLLPTIKSRCSQYSLRTLKEEEMLRLLRRTVKAENESLTKDIYEEIVQSAEGLPRSALQILDSVLAVDEDKRLAVAKRGVEQKETVLELCRALLHKAGWKKISVILASIVEAGEEEPERVRRAILGYAQAILLRGEENDQAAIVIEAFSTNTYDNGWSGITFSSYSAVKE